MEIKSSISCWGAMICSAVWAASQSKYGTVFAGLWLAAAVIIFIADAIKCFVK